MAQDAHKSSQDALVDPLDAGNLEALVAGRHGAPFDVLGPHHLVLHKKPYWVIRAWIPGATAITLHRAVARPGSGKATSAETVKETVDSGLPMKMLHPAGLFSVMGQGEQIPPEYQPHYRLVIQRGLGEAEDICDPYTFAPLLSDFDLYLIGEGTHEGIYERLGAHPRIIDGVSGVAYAVWAPNARRVSVVGDFNGWNDRAHPMRLCGSGIWELFLPGITIGALYKYAILSWNRGYQVLKADPFALAAEVRPGERAAQCSGCSDQHLRGACRLLETSLPR
jgi:1,4-alpha-glucan branching enzyme